MGAPEMVNRGPTRDQRPRKKQRVGAALSPMATIHSPASLPSPPWGGNHCSQALYPLPSGIPEAYPGDFSVKALRLAQVGEEAASGQQTTLTLSTIHKPPEHL